MDKNDLLADVLRRAVPRNNFFLLECQLVHASWSYGFTWLDGISQNLQLFSNLGEAPFACETRETYKH